MKLKKRFLCGLLMFSILFWGGIFIGNGEATTVYASMVDEAEQYDLGYDYSGTMVAYNQSGIMSRYWRFTIAEKSYVTLSFEYTGRGYGGSIYNESGEEVLKRDDIKFKENTVTDTSTGTLSRNLPAGTYYLEIYNNGTYGYTFTWDFTFSIQAEPIIVLPKGIISGLSNPSKGKIKVVCSTNSAALGYRIQYSKDVKFKSGVKTKYSESETVLLSGLKKGKVYYVKICPYSVYDDGSYVFGQNSVVKKIKVKI